MIVGAGRHRIARSRLALPILVGLGLLGGCEAMPLSPDAGEVPAPAVAAALPPAVPPTDQSAPDGPPPAPRGEPDTGRPGAFDPDTFGLAPSIEVRDLMGARDRMPAGLFIAQIADAVRSHPEYGSAAVDVEIAGLSADEARGGLFPQISFGATGSASRFSGTRNDLAGTSRNRGFDRDADIYARASQLLFDGGATFDRIDQSEAERSAGQRAQEATAGSLAVEAVRSHYEVLGYTLLVGIGETHLQRLQDLEDMVRARQQGGGGDLGDIAEVAAERANAETRHVALRRRLSDARNGYREIFGSSPAAALKWPAILPRLPTNRDDALALAAVDHPALAAARDRIRASGLGLSAVQAERLPGLRLEIDGARYDVATDPTDGVSMRVVGLLKLFDGGVLDAREGRAAAAVRKARFDEETARRTIERRAGGAFDALTLMDDEVRAAESALGATAASRIATRERFETVGGNLLNVLNAEVDAHNAAVAWVEVTMNREIARFRLLEAVGGLAPYMGLEVAP